MKLTSILPPEAIAPFLEAKNQSQVLHELAALFAKADPSLNSHEVFSALEEREKLGSTGVGSGVAIPHGKLNAAKKVVACFGRSLRGVDFQSQDGEPAHLFFALLAPENSAGLHLKALAKISRLMKDSSFRENLMQAKSAAEIFDLFLKEEDKD